MLRLNPGFASVAIITLVSEDREDKVLLVFEAAQQRSADRDTRNAFPMLRRDNVGFRLVRTYR